MAPADGIDLTRGRTVWQASWAWLGGPTLSRDVTITSQDGSIVAISMGIEPRRPITLDGIVLPGLVNTHSHAFHRLLRGRTHRQGGDFWLWRDRMYQIAAGLTPETYEEIATAVYVEMAKAGVTTVGEFHYVHHQEGGRPYTDPNEMGHSLIRAARRAGLRICLLDAGYFTAGFGDTALHPVQERFRDSDVVAWLERVSSLVQAHQADEDVVVGLAPHSVRAVPGDALRALAERPRDGIPTHIHVSEQPAENEACLTATSMTPTGLLAEAGLLDAGTTLVHATHVTATDIAEIGAHGAGICYCATTERDLADGLGPAADLVAAGASLSVGSDSHAVIDIFEEARGVELHERLRTGRRGVIDPVTLLEAATSGGSTALGFSPAGLQAGSLADFVVIDPDSPRLAGRDPASVEAVVFGASSSDVTDVIVGGRRIVSARSHPEWDDVVRFLRPSSP